MHFRQTIYKGMYEYFVAQSTVTRKKMQLSILLLLVGCRPSTAISFYNGDEVGFRTNIHNDKEFFHRIGDWYRHLKDRIYEKLYGPVSTPPPLTSATLSFYPDQDWAFRIGNWYFIRKMDENSDTFNSNDFNKEITLPQSTTQSWIQDTEKSVEVTDTYITNIAENTEDSSIGPNAETSTADITIPIMSMPSDVGSTIATTDIGLHEGLSTETDNGVEYQESDNNLIHKGSVEVLMG